MGLSPTRVQPRRPWGQPDRPHATPLPPSPTETNLPTARTPCAYFASSGSTHTPQSRLHAPPLFFFYCPFTRNGKYLPAQIQVRAAGARRGEGGRADRGGAGARHILGQGGLGAVFHPGVPRGRRRRSVGAGEGPASPDMRSPVMVTRTGLGPSPNRQRFRTLCFYVWSFFLLL